MIEITAKELMAAQTKLRALEHGIKDRHSDFKPDNERKKAAIESFRRKPYYMCCDKSIEEADNGRI
jgi:hypothetical protein